MALLGSMSSLPGLVACGFLMGRIGRINMLCGGLFTAMIFSLFLPLSLSAEAALLAILCLFAGKSYVNDPEWVETSCILNPNKLDQTGLFRVVSAGMVSDTCINSGKLSNRSKSNCFGNIYCTQ